MKNTDKAGMGSGTAPSVKFGQSFSFQQGAVTGGSAVSRVEVQYHGERMGYSVTVDGKAITTFENPLEPYYFASEFGARRAGEQERDRV